MNNTDTPAPHDAAPLLGPGSSDEAGLAPYGWLVDRLEQKGMAQEVAAVRHWLGEHAFLHQEIKAQVDLRIAERASHESALAVTLADARMVERERCAPLIRRLEAIADGVRLYGAPDQGFLAQRIEGLCRELRA